MNFSLQLIVIVLGSFNVAWSMQPASAASARGKSIFIMCIDPAWLKNKHFVESNSGDITKPLRDQIQAFYAATQPGHQLEFTKITLPPACKEKLSEANVDAYIKEAITLAICVKTMFRDKTVAGVTPSVHVVTCGHGGYVTALASHLLDPQFSKASAGELTQEADTYIQALLEGRYSIGRPEGKKLLSDKSGLVEMSLTASKEIHRTLNGFLHEPTTEDAVRSLVTFNHTLVIPALLSAMPGTAPLGVLAKVPVVQQLGAKLGTNLLAHARNLFFPVHKICTVHVMGGLPEHMEHIWDTDGATRSDYDFTPPPPPKTLCCDCLCRCISGCREGLDEHPEVKQVLTILGKVALTIALAAL